MPYKDPEKQRKWQRDKMRRVRAGVEKDKVSDQKWRTFSLDTAEDLRRIIEEQIELVRNSDAETLTKARVIKDLSKEARELLAIVVYEQRLAEIEAADSDAPTASFKDAKR